MWMGIWRKCGEDLYIRMASFENDTLLSVLFGNFELLGDILNISDKLNFYCFLTRFIHIQILVCDGIMCTKVEWVHFRGNNSFIFILAFILIGAQFTRKRICS